MIGNFIRYNDRRGRLLLGKSAWAGVVMFFGMFGGRAAGTSPLLPSVETSVEWSVVEAELIVRGTVRPGMQRDFFVQGVRWREVTLDVGETIKGEAAEQVM